MLAQVALERGDPINYVASGLPRAAHRARRRRAAAQHARHQHHGRPQRHHRHGLRDGPRAGIVPFLPVRTRRMHLAEFRAPASFAGRSPRLRLAQRRACSANHAIEGLARLERHPAIGSMGPGAGDQFLVDVDDI
jgi:hypothetical protein